MSDFKEVNRLNLLIEDCLRAIRSQGAHAGVTFMIPGKWGEHTHARMSPNGPEGQIVAETNDGKKLIVLFPAAKTLTKLQEVRDDFITG